eukprot:888359-Pyramimonas_sp.AAC.1
MGRIRVTALARDKWHEPVHGPCCYMVAFTRHLHSSVYSSLHSSIYSTPQASTQCCAYGAHEEYSQPEAA